MMAPFAGALGGNIGNMGFTVGCSELRMLVPTWFKMIIIRNILKIADSTTFHSPYSYWPHWLPYCVKLSRPTYGAKIMSYIYQGRGQCFLCEDSCGRCQGLGLQKRNRICVALPDYWKWKQFRRKTPGIGVSTDSGPVNYHFKIFSFIGSKAI